MYDFIKDPTFFNLVRGPFVWIAVLVFIGGSFYKVREIIGLAKKEKAVLPFVTFNAAVRSLLHWVIPYASVGSRKRWVFTAVTFLFHFGLVILPIFLLAHNVLFYESWGISLWTFPEVFSDSMTLIVIGCCVFFFLRRLIAPEVRFVTFADDYFILLVAFLPFLTGYLAYHQLALPHKTMVTLHMLSGEIMLIAIPFTRLVHMFYFFLTRSWMGSQFALWNSRDW